MKIRVAVADDHALFRQGLISLLRLQPNLEVVAEIDRAATIPVVLAETRCDVLLLDLQMERWVLEDVESFAEHATVVILTASERIEDAIASVRHGARAVVHKRFAIETLMNAIEAATAGDLWLPPAVQSVMASDWTAPRARLTSREKEIVVLVARGLRNAEIGEQLFISEATVKTHVNNMLRKIGGRARVDLVLYAVRGGLASERGGSA